MLTRHRQRDDKCRPGASCLNAGRVRFRVWAPRCRSLAVRIAGAESQVPAPMADAGDGWFEATLDGIGPGTRYVYVLDGVRERPDPAGFALPEGVHGPSEVVDTAAFVWTDGGWQGLSLKDMVLYEIHVGTFTPEGTFDAIIPRLDHLRGLGVTAIELMPVASFPGARNWGYDGVGLFAPQRTYGGPHGLQRLIDACHACGLAVVLDVVYNHLGPEGNYLAEFGPYFTDRYRTPWGQAVNYDGEGSRVVRDFVIANALYWIREYHIDGLRLDAIHGIFDASPIHIVRELNEAVRRLAHRLGRIVPVVAESDLNDRRVIDSVRKGGYGLAGQWSDDFHHCLHTILTGERKGYYADFGSLEQMAKAYTDSFVYEGQHSIFRGRPHGTPAKDLPAERFVVFAQNHDQVGNRAQGDRLHALADFDRVKLAATALLLHRLCGFRPAHRRDAGSPGGVCGFRLEWRGARPAGPDDLRAVQAHLGVARTGAAPLALGLLPDAAGLAARLPRAGHGRQTTAYRTRGGRAVAAPPQEGCRRDGGSRAPELQCRGTDSPIAPPAGRMASPGG
jgi:maltooligosyltrehalose trehalohydrolase